MNHFFTQQHIYIFYFLCQCRNPAKTPPLEVKDHKHKRPIGSENSLTPSNRPIQPEHPWCQLHAGGTLLRHKAKLMSLTPLSPQLKPSRWLRLRTPPPPRAGSPTNGQAPKSPLPLGLISNGSMLSHPQQQRNVSSSTRMKCPPCIAMVHSQDVCSSHAPVPK